MRSAMAIRMAMGYGLCVKIEEVRPEVTVISIGGIVTAIPHDRNIPVVTRLGHRIVRHTYVEDIVRMHRV